MEHLQQLRAVTAAFEADARALDLSQPTAALRWTGHDLVAHLGEIHRWAAAIVTTGQRQARTNVPELTQPAADWYAGGRRMLLNSLESRPASDPVWTLKRSDRTAGFWHRRQLHETIVHLWDLRSTLDPDAPPPPEVDAETHADGVDELFDVFVPKAAEQTQASLPAPLTLRATDTDRFWTVHRDLSCDFDTVSRSTVVSGPAGALLLFAWNRYTPASPALTISGNAKVVEEFRRARIRP
jgi:uncharacterized protein (TIGR03083 family)